MVESPHQLFESLKVLPEARFSVFVGMIEQTNRAPPTAVANRSEQLEVQFSLTQGQDLLAEFFAVGRHPVEVECEQMGLHAGEQIRKALHLVMAVVKVVNDADVGYAPRLEQSDYFQLIFGFAEPAPVII